LWDEGNNCSARRTGNERINNDAADPLGFDLHLSNSVGPL
jgi:hypothetical protein